MAKKDYEIWVNQDGIEDLKDLEIEYNWLGQTRDVGFGTEFLVSVELSQEQKDRLENLWDCDLE